MRAATALVLLLSTLLLAAPAPADVPPVYVVVFTHVEDNTPGGLLGTSQSRQNYLTIRANLIAMAAMAESAGVQWTLQPDWKILEAALLYEDAATRATTNDKNVLRYLKEDRAVVIDPHSHENGGYNYTDVAHLLDSLGVGATTVIGGHIWDPDLPQFSEWDRFRVPVQGAHYPGAFWRGDILIGSGTPNHVNDPLVSGVWRPRDRDHYFEHDPAGNIVAIGPYKHSFTFIQELIGLYRSGTVPANAMLTFSGNVGAGTLNMPGGLAAVRDTVLAPVAAWRDSGLVVSTDFTSMIHTWETVYGSFSYLYDAEAPTTGVPYGPAPAAVVTLAAGANPCGPAATLRFSLERAANVRLAVFDLQGRTIAVLVDGPHEAGDHAVTWDARGRATGLYLCRLDARETGGGTVASATRKLIVAR
ncbi:MAG TPA: hypothetical protein VJY35_08305 [Candidatus Eisenbacteria bacterium]|nr:hypothetical protein [Candidatus Eisenbacteria bacterium]